jgi:hypothetical protein
MARPSIHKERGNHYAGGWNGKYGPLNHCTRFWPAHVRLTGKGAGKPHLEAALGENKALVTATANNVPLARPHRRSSS